MASKIHFYQHIGQISEKMDEDFDTSPIRIWILAARVLCFADAPFQQTL